MMKKEACQQAIRMGIQEIAFTNHSMLTVAFNKDKDATAKYYVAKFSDLLDLPCINPEEKE